MTDTQNPAGRLHMLLSEAGAQNKNHTMLKVWSSVFRLSAPESAIDVTRHLITLFGLIDETKRLLSQNEQLNHKLYLASFPDIETFVSPVHLNAPLSSIMGYLKPQVLTRLEFCSEELKRSYSEELLTSDDLKKIVDAVDDLFDIVSVSSVEPTLKMSLLEEIEKIRAAVATYRIRGARGVKEALQSLLGSVVWNRDAVKIEAVRNTDVIDRLAKLLDTLDSFSARALKLHRLLTKPVSFLLSLATKPDTSAPESFESEVGPEVAGIGPE